MVVRTIVEINLQIGLFWYLLLLEWGHINTGDEKNGKKE